MIEFQIKAEKHIHTVSSSIIYVKRMYINYRNMQNKNFRKNQIK